VPGRLSGERYRYVAAPHRSDGLEFTCWNGEVVRLAFALDCHDREVIGWVANTAGISGEMIRDMIVR
jgi:putative transposase